MVLDDDVSRMTFGMMKRIREKMREIKGGQGLNTGAGAVVRTTSRRRREPERSRRPDGFTGPYAHTRTLSGVAFSRRRSDGDAVRVETRVDGGQTTVIVRKPGDIVDRRRPGRIGIGFVLPRVRGRISRRVRRR